MVFAGLGLVSAVVSDVNGLGHNYDWLRVGVFACFGGWVLHHGDFCGYGARFGVVLVTDVCGW